MSIASGMVLYGMVWYAKCLRDKPLIGNFTILIPARYHISRFTSFRRTLLLLITTYEILYRLRFFSLYYFSFHTYSHSKEPQNIRTNGFL